MTRGLNILVGERLLSARTVVVAINLSLAGGFSGEGSLIQFYRWLLKCCRVALCVGIALLAATDRECR